MNYKTTIEDDQPRMPCLIRSLLDSIFFSEVILSVAPKRAFYSNAAWKIRLREAENQACKYLTAETFYKQIRRQGTRALTATKPLPGYLFGTGSNDSIVGHNIA